MSETLATNNQKRKSIGKRIVYQATEFTTSVGLKIGIERSGLICLLFHAIMPGATTQASDSVLPALGLRIDDYREIFELFLKAGYIFVSADMLLSDMPDKGKFVHVTFDDGYFNNVQILPLLEEYNIPAHIFVATSNVLQNKKYWWDAVYQHMHLVGKNQAEIASSIESLKKQTHTQITNYLIKEYGVMVFSPCSDVDRPLTPDELKDLAKHSLITIGNHTRDHILVDRSDSELVLKQVTGAQEDLASIIGFPPYSFAFPNGNYNHRSLGLLEDNGFKLGFSCDFRSNHLRKDFKGRRKLRLGRFSFISSLELNMQCKMFRAADLSPIVLGKRLRKMVRR